MKRSKLKRLQKKILEQFEVPRFGRKAQKKPKMCVTEEQKILDLPVFLEGQGQSKVRVQTFFVVAKVGFCKNNEIVFVSRLGEGEDRRKCLKNFIFHTLVMRKCIIWIMFAYVQSLLC